MPEMRLKNRVVIAGFGLLLAGCAPQVAITEHLADEAKENAYATSEKLYEWMLTPPPEKSSAQAIRPTYCYHAQTDILCYRQPMPGWEGRLVAYQGTNAKAPPPPMMEPLPQQLTSAADLPANRAAAAQPVFAKPPAPLPETEKNTDATGATTVDPSQEQLPNPANAPQM